MATKKPNTQTPAQKQAADRQKARDSGALDILIATARGEPLPRRDVDGNIIAYDTIEPAVRVAAAEKLVRKFVPDLKSVEVTGDSGVTFVVNAAFPLPGSQRGQRDDQQIEGSVSFDQLEEGLHQLQAHEDARHAPFDGPEPTPTPDAATAAPQRRRRRKPVDLDQQQGRKTT